MNDDAGPGTRLNDVIIQENGIIRDKDGRFLARLNSDVTYDSIKNNKGYVDDREETHFFIGCVMNKRWAHQFIGLLNRMQELGGVGSSREVKFFADGDGDFRPKFKISHDIVPAEGQGKEKLFFDAG